MGKYCFAADIGGTTVKLGLFTPEGEIVNKWEIPTVKTDNGTHILPDIADAIKVEMSNRGIEISDVIGIGVGAPGPVDNDGIVHKAVNLGWDIVNIQDELGKLTNLPVKAGNDANVAALGEMWKGGGQGYKDLVVVTLGTGVGGGIIVNGKMLVGAIGAAGEIGHIHIEDDETDVCGCGNKGCLEQYGSATGITRIANKMLNSTDKSSVLRGNTVDAKAVFDAVKAGDELAIEVAEVFGKYLGKGLASIACVTNPEAFVIGGGVSKAGEVLINYIKKYYEPNVFHASRNVKFELAKLGNDAGIYGAAKLVLDN